MSPVRPGISEGEAVAVFGSIALAVSCLAGWLIMRAKGFVTKLTLILILLFVLFMLAGSAIMSMMP